LNLEPGILPAVNQKFKKDMKKLAFVCIVILCARAVMAQGFIDWGTGFTGLFRAPIYNVDPANPNVSTSGQSALGVPAGGTVYGGLLLQGTGYTFAFFAGPSLINDPNALALIVSTTFRTANGNILPAGLVSGNTAQIPGVLPGQTAKFQMRVWDNQGGTLTTWAQALAAGTAMGTSALVTSGPLGGIDPNTGGIVANPQTVGWTSFNIAVVPEPTSLALAGLGAVALLSMRRRK
jgi:hypothetical protein